MVDERVKRARDAQRAAIEARRQSIEPIPVTLRETPTKMGNADQLCPSCGHGLGGGAPCAWCGWPQEEAQREKTRACTKPKPRYRVKARMKRL